jgi:uncharacterized protein YciI
MSDPSAPSEAPDLWVVVTTSRVPWPEVAARLPEHLRYQESLVARGVLVMSGPWMGPAGLPTGSGLTLLRAADQHEAEQIASADPLVAAGLRDVAVHAWKLSVGAELLR